MFKNIIDKLKLRKSAKIEARYYSSSEADKIFQKELSPVETEILSKAKGEIEAIAATIINRRIYNKWLRLAELRGEMDPFDDEIKKLENELVEKESIIPWYLYYGWIIYVGVFIMDVLLNYVIFFVFGKGPVLTLIISVGVGLILFLFLRIFVNFITDGKIWKIVLLLVIPGVYIITASYIMGQMVVGIPRTVASIFFGIVLTLACVAVLMFYFYRSKFVDTFVKIKELKKKLVELKRDRNKLIKERESIEKELERADKNYQDTKSKVHRIKNKAGDQISYFRWYRRKFLSKFGKRLELDSEISSPYSLVEIPHVFKVLTYLDLLRAYHTWARFFSASLFFKTNNF